MSIPVCSATFEYFLCSTWLVSDCFFLEHSSSSALEGQVFNMLQLFHGKFRLRCVTAEADIDQAAVGDAPFLGKNSMETPIGQVAEESLGTLRNIFLPGDIPQCKGGDTREGLRCECDWHWWRDSDNLYNTLSPKQQTSRLISNSNKTWWHFALSHESTLIVWLGATGIHGVKHHWWKPRWNA